MLARVLAWTLLTLLALAVVDFSRRTQSSFQLSSRPVPGVIFTGQFDRVHAGLDLLERGRISPVFISGTNAGAGISISGFADQFKLSPALRAALYTGELVLSEDANNTYQNAWESSRWAATLPAGQPLVLITSRFHMPRASVALEQTVGQRAVLRYIVGGDAPEYRSVFIEFIKYVWTFGGGPALLRSLENLSRSSGTLSGQSMFADGIAPPSIDSTNRNQGSMGRFCRCICSDKLMHKKDVNEKPS